MHLLRKARRSPCIQMRHLLFLARWRLRLTTRQLRWSFLKARGSLRSRRQAGRSPRSPRLSVLHPQAVIRTSSSTSMSTLIKCGPSTFIPTVVAVPAPASQPPGGQARRSPRSPKGRPAHAARPLPDLLHHQVAPPAAQFRAICASNAKLFPSFPSLPACVLSVRKPFPRE